jgi:hypothetical protein
VHKIRAPVILARMAVSVKTILPCVLVPLQTHPTVWFPVAMRAIVKRPILVLVTRVTMDTTVVLRRLATAFQETSQMFAVRQATV